VRDDNGRNGRAPWGAAVVHIGSGLEPKPKTRQRQAAPGRSTKRG